MNAQEDSAKTNRAKRLRDLRQLGHDLLCARERYETLMWKTRGHRKDTAPSSATSHYAVHKSDDGSYVVRHVGYGRYDITETIKDGLPTLADGKRAAQADHDAHRTDVSKGLRADLAYINRAIAGIKSELDKLHRRLADAEIERDEVRERLDALIIDREMGSPVGPLVADEEATLDAIQRQQLAAHDPGEPD
jgi:hypothetical protein